MALHRQQHLTRFLATTATTIVLIIANFAYTQSAALHTAPVNKFRINHHHQRQNHHYGHHPLNRPTASRDLPVIDLIEPPDKIYDPKSEDLNFKFLREKMGGHFDPDFMSVQRPLDSLLNPNGTLELSFKRTKRGQIVPVGKMPNDIRRLRTRNLPILDGGRLKSNAGKKLRKKFKQMLWSFTYCPVVYRWKDLGIRFWPRWIREGSCYTGGGSCSVPAGMSCKPKRSTGKTVLRWHCQNWDQKKLCKWLAVRYPVITECTCSC